MAAVFLVTFCVETCDRGHSQKFFQRRFKIL